MVLIYLVINRGHLKRNIIHEYYGVCPPPPNVSTVALKAAVAPKNQSLTETPADSFTPSSVAQRSGGAIVSSPSGFDFLEPRTLIEHLAQAGQALVTGSPSKVFPGVSLSLRSLEAMVQKLEDRGLTVVTSMMTPGIMTRTGQTLTEQVALALKTKGASEENLLSALQEITSHYAEKPLPDVYLAVALHDDSNTAQQIKDNYIFGFPGNMAIQKSGITAEELQRVIQEVTGLSLKAFNDYAILMKTDGNLF